MRLAALMKLGVIYIFTHDSIGLGEDGPTHQPVEHLASLRCIPGLSVIRPADANETVQAWRAALERRNGPTALILSRQKLPTIDRSKFSSAEGVLRGGYRVTPEGPTDVLLIATGSEVALALAAWGSINERRRMQSRRDQPSRAWIIFEAQDGSAYREAVIPSVC
jgi:transketolase